MIRSLATHIASYTDATAHLVRVCSNAAVITRVSDPITVGVDLIWISNVNAIVRCAVQAGTRKLMVRPSVEITVWATKEAISSKTSFASARNLYAFRRKAQSFVTIRTKLVFTPSPGRRQNSQPFCGSKFHLDRRYHHPHHLRFMY